MHFPVDGRDAPFTLAHVDLDDGPRILARLVRSGELPPGTGVRVVGDDDGDVLVAGIHDDDRSGEVDQDGADS